jgi:hypothetical protein
MHNHPEITEEVLHSWNRSHGALYQISESDLRWNGSEQRFLRYWGEKLEGVPVLWGETTPEGAALGILPKGIWLSLFGEIPTGGEAAFAAAVESYAKRKGKSRVAVASDEFHFLPGIPVDEPGGERLAQAFRDRGFSSADCADFLGTAENPKCAEYIQAAIEQARAKGWELRLVKSAGDQEEMQAFLSREFSGRWKREWLLWLDRKDMGRAFWNLLRDEKGTVVGFSRLAVRGRLQPLSEGWTPGAMRLGNADSCLGPIGIAASARGHGAGKILLGLSLHELSLQGAKQICIDWTNAYNYYTPLGFQIARRYLSTWKEI